MSTCQSYKLCEFLLSLRIICTLGQQYWNTSIVHDTGIIKNVPVLYSSIVPVLLYKIISIVYNCYWEKGKLKKWIVKLIFIKTNNATDGIYCIH